MIDLLVKYGFISKMSQTCFPDDVGPCRSNKCQSPIPRYASIMRIQAPGPLVCMLAVQGKKMFHKQHYPAATSLNEGDVFKINTKTTLK